MIARLLISPDKRKRTEEINKILSLHPGGVKLNHPDILYFQAGEKLGIAETRKIKEHFSLKPYSAKGRVVVLEDGGSLTIEAQNALLKTLEELPPEAVLILGASSDANLLPTILSRCLISYLERASYDTLEYHKKYSADLEELLDASLEERFEYVERLKEKEQFLLFLTSAFRNKLYAPRPHPDKPKVVEFLKELLQAEQRAKQNVNIRAILEYLMLVMP